MNKDYLFQEIIVKNPVLVGTIGLCPVVAICTSLKSALIMSVITILTLMIAQALSALLLKHLPQWLRMSLYMLVGMVVVAPSMLLVEKLDPTTMLALGIYLPLLSVNPIIVRQCEREGVNAGLGESLVNSLCAGVGYSLVLVIVGFVREIFGNGTIWGVEVLPFAPAIGMLMPMGGFIVLAFMAALLRAYFKKIDPAYAEELAVNSRTAIKGHKGLKALLIETDEDEQSASSHGRFEIIQMTTSKPVEVEGGLGTQSEIAVAAISDAQAEVVEAQAEVAGVEQASVQSETEIVETHAEVQPDRTDVSAADAAIDEILASVAAEHATQATEAVVAEPIFEEPEMDKELIYDSADAEFAEETSPVITQEVDQKESKKSGSFFGKFGKKSEKSEDNKKSRKPAKPSGRTGKNTGKKSAETVNEPVVSPTESVEAPVKPKFEFITLELPSAVKKAEEKAAAEKAAAERAAAEKAAADKLAAEKAAAEKRAAEKAAEERRAAEETLARERAAAERAARESQAAPTFAAPLSEEEAKAETSTAKRQHASNIVYRSEELERLMSLSLDDILNGLPTGEDDGEESEK